MTAPPLPMGVTMAGDLHDAWYVDGEDHGWLMPPVARWKRLPVIRHVRAMLATLAVDEHEALWRAAGLIPTGYDRWVIYGIWYGLELTPSTATVKPLVWYDCMFAGQPAAAADTEFGPWMAVAYSGHDGRWAHTDPSGNDSEDDWGTRAECEAAAQADYATRILSAIETPVSAWQGIDSAKPPKDRPFLARNPGFAAFIAEWSDVDEEYIHDSGVDGWICLYFSHWMEIPDLSPAPPSTKQGGA